MRALLTSLVLLCAACPDPVDRAAKVRIFSPEDPPQAVAAAKEKLPPQEVADDPKVARRVLGMGAAEATERLGPHQANATIGFEWTTGGKNVRLTETRTLLAGSGGVSGDFHAKFENSRDQGVEVMRVKGVVYARSRYGKFRQRSRDRGMAERLREEAFRAMPDFDELFRGRIKLTAQGTSTLEGRTAWKYVVSLGEAPPGVESTWPAPQLAKNGPDETTARRLAFRDLRAPRTLQGEVFVDVDTSVVVKARLDGRIGVATDGGDAEVRLTLDSAITHIGQEPGLTPPKDALPDQDKPLAIAATLERFGIQRATPDAGVGVKKAPPGAEEPQDDAE